MPPQREWLDKDYYAVLGVSKDASSDAIKKAYRKLARENHPDAKPDDSRAEQRFKEIGEAYRVVGDEDTRKEYDEIRRLGAAGMGGFGGGMAGGFSGGDGDLNDVLRTIFGQTGAGGGPGRQRGFGPFAGGGRTRGGPDLAADVHLSFEDALEGVRTTLRITGDGACGTCNGSGAAPGTRPHTCTTCGGRGQVTVDQGLFSIANPCPTCAGRGQVVDDPCRVCNGTGRVVKPRQLSVRIPAGVKDGATVRVPGRGGPGTGGGPPGDVIVHVHVAPHRLFGRRGDNVTIDVPVTYTEATLGTKLRVPTPDGSATSIKIPAGTASGRVFRVRGKGAPGKRGKRGDLLVTVQVQIPERVDRKHKRLLEQLAELEDTSVRDGALFGAHDG